MKRHLLTIGIVVAILLIVGGAAGYMIYDRILAPQVEGTEVCYIQVYPDDNTNSVSEKLAAVEGMGTMQGFAPLMKHYKYDGRVKPGNYAIRPGDSMRDICLRLMSGNQTPVRLVVPSVRTLDRLAGAVGKQLMTDSATIMTMLTDQHVMDSLGYTKQTFPTLFIPNTYEVYWTMNAEQFVARMKKEHARFWNEERRAKARAQGLTPEEVVTLAFFSTILL